MAVQKKIRTWLLIAFAIETLSATYGFKIDFLSPFLSVTWFISGLAIAILVLFLPPANLFPTAGFKKGYTSLIVKSALFLLMIFSLYLFPRYWLDLIPIDPDYADMLPVINVMDQRFLHGNWHQVYDPIPDIWEGARPIYLPAMWLPFALAVKLDIDMRWTTVACLFVSFSIFLYLIRIRSKNISVFLVLAIGILLFSWLLAFDDSHNLISMSEEGVVILYYCILVTALITGNIVFIGIASSLCILSRYAMIGWIPAFVLFLILEKKRKELIQLAITGFSSLLFLFILPFGWKPFVDLLKLPGSYINFAKAVWTGSRSVFWFSLGFAKFFGASRAALLHSILLILSFTVPPTFVAFCHYLKKKKLISNIPLATLKLSVVIFYAFIDVPFLYLFYTSSFISLLMLGNFCVSQDKEAPFTLG